MTTTQPDQTLRQSLRQYYKQRRAALQPTERAAAHSKIYTQLDKIVASRKPHRVFAYLAMPGGEGTGGEEKAGTEPERRSEEAPGETDITAWLQAEKLPVAVPRIGKKNEESLGPNPTMTFHPYIPGQLQINDFGIREPLAGTLELVPKSNDLWLIPLVTYDSSGNRLGMGGGYYDRYLSALPERPDLIGVAYACQQHPTPLPSATWDIPLDAVITEAGLQEFAEGKAADSVQTSAQD